MLTTTHFHVAVLAALLSFSLADAQLVASLPQCVQTCITQSGDDNCSSSDVKCVCRASNGNFLPDVITCLHGNCDNSMDANIFLTPLQLACEVAGTPISSEAIQNAENEASSLASQVTTTVTETDGGSGGSASSATTTTNTGSAQSVLTLTTTASGITVAIVYPVSIESTKTIYGSPTITLPAIISSTAATDFSSPSTSNSLNESGSGSTDSVSSTATQTDSVDAQTISPSRTSSERSSKTKASSSSTSINSDLLNAAPREGLESCMGLLIAIVACVMLI